MKNFIFKILATILVLTLTLCLVGCGEKSGKVDSSNMDVVDLKGREITFVTWGQTLKIYEDASDEKMQTYYLRMKEMEELYNCKFVFKEVAAGEILSSFVAGEMGDAPLGDVVLMRESWATSAFNDNHLLDLSKVFDGDLPQFYKPAVDTFKQDNGSFYSIAFYDFNPAENIIYFNKDLFEERGVDVKNLYKDVNDGKWTFDKYLEVAKKVAVNKNGTYEVYGGFGTTAGDALSDWLIPFGAEIMTQNEDGTYASGLKSQEMYKALENAKKVVDCDYIFTRGGNDTYETPFDMFTSKTLAMYNGAIMHLTKVKDNCNFQFGVLPFPIAKEGDEYIASAMVTNIAVMPKSFEKDMETAQAIADIVTYVYQPVYQEIETQLRSGFAMNTYDEESVEMLLKLSTTENWHNFNYIRTGLTPSYNEIVKNTFSKVINGSTSIDAGVAAVDDAWNNVIKEYNKTLK